MFGTSVLELSESALKQNLQFLRKVIGPQVRLSSVVKGFAYGHGFAAFVPLAEKCGINHFSVFSAEEAMKVVRARTRDSDVMIMGSITEEEVAWAIENGVSFYVFDQHRLETALRTARQLQLPARIHLELETGMNRLGFEESDLPAVAATLQEAAHDITLEGVCTHYAGAESIGNYVRVQQQIARFNELCGLLERAGVQIACRHTASSAATLTYPETHMEMVRVGIAQYGYWPSQETRMHFLLRNGGMEYQPRVEPLRRVLRWRSRVMGIKVVEPGEFVGYGTSFLTERKSRFAAVPVGYSSGFNRNLSNHGHVLIGGRRAPVAGIVNMNMLMADITDIPGVHAGDEVVLIGKQKRGEISVGAFSDLTRFLNYEVLARLSQDIRREVVK